MGTSEIAEAKTTPTKQNLPVGKSRLARSTAFNFIGQFLPILAGIGFMPYIVHGLGPDRFGILGISWVIFGYFGLFDFGLGRATTKFVAEWLSNSESSADARQIPILVWTSIGFQIALGLVGLLVMAACTPELVGRALKVPPALLHEVRITFYILAASLPLVLVQNSLRAVLEGCQRFDLVNLLRVPSSILVFLIPAASLPFGLRLPGIVLALAISRLVFIVAHVVFCVRELPDLAKRPEFSRHVLRKLMSFGGWVTVANIINPILISADRFLIGSLLSVAMVGYYTAPFEAMTRIWLIPTSLTITIFPACSALGLGRKRELGMLYSRSLKYLFLTLAPLSLVLVLFASPILRLWLGSEFESKSFRVLQILAIGVPINCLAHIPYCFLQALDRPRLPAILFLCELPVYLTMVSWAIMHGGINGAALAWSIRVAIEVALLMVMVWRAFGFSLGSLVSSPMLRALAILVVIGGAMTVTKTVTNSFLPVQAPIVAILLVIFGISIWFSVLDDLDRQSIGSILGPLRKVLRGRIAA
jgi:O-antigen/teichoic acid export membrane protein